MNNHNQEKCPNCEDGRGEIGEVEEKRLPCEVCGGRGTV